MPTYNPDLFDPRKRTWDQITQTTCQAELGHETIAVLSFVLIMTEQYRRKHYNEGIFHTIHKNTAKISYMVYIFFGVILAGSIYGMNFTVKRQAENSLNGQGDAAVAGVILAFFGLFALISLAVIIVSIVRHLRGAERLKVQCAKENGYTVEDVNQFEHQALEMESRVISLLGKVSKAAAGQEDGIITRDYIFLTLSRNVLIRLSDLKAACLYTQKIHAGKGGNLTEVEYLLVGLMGKDGASVVAECTKESGLALIEYLKEKCPGLNTVEDRILESSEYDDLWAEINHKVHR